MKSYYLMHKNNPVLEFSHYNETLKFLNREEAPFSIRKMPETYETIQKFCQSRVMIESRKYRDIIIRSCNVINSSPVSLCLTGGAFTFRDSYWIREKDGFERWKDVNLYQNKISEKLAETALTGEESDIRILDENEGNISGEITGLGSKAKCFFKEGGHICMAKHIDEDSIVAEILSHSVAQAMNLSSAVYTREFVYDMDCSVCHIKTNENVELITARDVLMHYECPMKFGTDYYQLFMKVDPVNFMRMQLFDYITLNVDRNKDNFALYTENGKVQGLYDVFDHDSCFQGISENAIYYVTGAKFSDSYKMFRETYPGAFEKVRPDIDNLYEYLKGPGKALFDRHDRARWHGGALRRVTMLLEL